MQRRKGAGQYSPTDSIYLGSLSPHRGKVKGKLYFGKMTVMMVSRMMVERLHDFCPRHYVKSWHGFSHLFLVTASEVTTLLLLLPKPRVPLLLPNAACLSAT